MVTRKPMDKDTYKAVNDRLVAEIKKTKSKRKKAELYRKLDALQRMYLEEYGA